MKRTIKNKLIKAFNQAFEQAKQKTTERAITCINEEATIGVISRQPNKFPLNPWRTKDIALDGISLEEASLNKAQRIVLNKTLLKKALAILESSGTDELVTLIVSEQAPFIISNEDFAVLIGLHIKGANKTAEQEWEQIKTPLDTLKVIKEL